MSSDVFGCDDTSQLRRVYTGVTGNSALGSIAAAATFPRIYGRSISARGRSTELSLLCLRRGIPAKMDVKPYKTLMDYLCTSKFLTVMIKAEKDSL